MRNPTTVLTDYLLGLVSFGCALASLRRAGAANRFWALAFGAQGIGACAAATAHAVESSPPGPLEVATWRAALVGAGLSNAGLLAAGIAGRLAGPWRAVGLLLCGVKLAAYLALLTRRQDFRLVVIDNLVATAAVAALQAAPRRHAGAGDGRPIVAALALSVAGGAVQQRGVRLHRHFDHNDLFHVIQTAATLLLHRGASA